MSLDGFKIIFDLIKDADIFERRIDEHGRKMAAVELKLSVFLRGMGYEGVEANSTRLATFLVLERVVWTSLLKESHRL